MTMVECVKCCPRALLPHDGPWLSFVPQDSTPTRQAAKLLNGDRPTLQKRFATLQSPTRSLIGQS